MTYVSKRAPRAKQAEALEACAWQKSFALFMAMRTGKTKVVLDDFGMLEDAGTVQDLCIIAPAGVYKTWPAEMKKEWPDALLKRTTVGLWESGPSKTYLRSLEQLLAEQKGPRVWLVNVEALSRVKQARAMTEEFLSQRKSYCAIDESTIIKNEGSERTEYIVEELGDLPEVKRIMSGLPTPRSPLDLYNQFKFLDPEILGYKNYVAYRSRYAVVQDVCFLPQRKLEAMLARRAGARFYMEGIGTVEPSDLGRQDLLAELKRRKIYVQTVPLIKEYRNEEELREKIAPHSFRVTLADCYDLPPKMYLPRHVTLTKEQERIYAELKKFNTSEIENLEFVTASQVIARLLRQHQVLCGHTVDESGKEHMIPENRTTELLNLLREYDGKAIIWCSYDTDVRKIEAALIAEYGEGCCARFWGGNRKTREQEEATFKTDPACRFMVATPAAGGRGREWSLANLVVYYSNTDNLEHRDQSEERAQMVGKEVSVLYVDLMVPGTVDEKIVHSLRNKINMAATITGDNWREWLV